MKSCLRLLGFIFILVTRGKAVHAAAVETETTTSGGELDYSSGAGTVNVTMPISDDTSNNLGSIVIGIAFTIAGLTVLAAFAYLLCKKVKGQELESFNNPIKFEDETAL